MPVAILNTFGDSVTVPNCHVISMPPFLEVHPTSVRPAEATEATESCLFCDSPLSLQCMCNHVTGHLQNMEMVAEPSVLLSD